MRAQRLIAGAFARTFRAVSHLRSTQAAIRRGLARTLNLGTRQEMERLEAEAEQLEGRIARLETELHEAKAR